MKCSIMTQKGGQNILDTLDAYRYRCIKDIYTGQVLYRARNKSELTLAVLAHNINKFFVVLTEIAEDLVYPSERMAADLNGMPVYHWYNERINTFFKIEAEDHEVEGFILIRAIPFIGKIHETDKFYEKQDEDIFKMFSYCT